MEVGELFTNFLCWKPKQQLSNNIFEQYLFENILFITSQPLYRSGMTEPTARKGSCGVAGQGTIPTIKQQRRHTPGIRLTPPDHQRNQAATKSKNYKPKNTTKIVCMSFLP